MDHGLHRRCTSTQDGRDLLMVLAMEATTQETTETKAPATSRTEGSQGRKAVWSGTPNWMVQFPEDTNSSSTLVQAVGA
jgi:hypothetical protein